MTVQAALFNRLTNFSGLAALVASRVYPVHAPQNVSKPYITYHRISAVRVLAMVSNTGIVRARYQFDVWADSFDKTQEIAEQIRLALDRWSGTLEGTEVEVAFILNDGPDLYEDRERLHHKVMDFEINYRE